MGRRLELEAIVNDLTQSMASRNNDYRGYWAVGQLYNAALSSGVNHIHIDVFNDLVEPLSEEITDIPHTYKTRILRQVKSRKMNQSWIVKASIDYWFETEVDYIGAPYIGLISIHSDVGKHYTGRFGGYCKPHDPKKEGRRRTF